MKRVDSPLRHARRHLLLGCAGIALASAPAALSAQAYNASPIVVGGSATITNGPGTTTVNVNTPQAIVNWSSTGGGVFLPAGRIATYQNGVNPATGQPNPNFAILNRIFASGAAIFDGTVISRLTDAAGTRPGGTVVFQSSGGIIVGSTGVFDVGNLVLTTATVNVDGSNNFVEPDGTIRFNGVSVANSAVQTLAGSQINATSEGSYVALVGSNVVHGGATRVNGSTAYVAAENLSIRHESGLFDIVVNAGGGTGGNVNPLVHTGSTGGPASTGGADNHRIYMVAVPRTQAITMLLTGSAGYDAPLSATISNGQIILSAGYNVRGRNNDGTAASGRELFGAPGPNDQVAPVSTQQAIFQINGGNYTSSVIGRAATDFFVGGTLGTPSFTQDLNIAAVRTAQVSSVLPLQVMAIGGSLTVSADDIKNFVTTNPSAVLNALAGSARVFTQNGGGIAVAGNVRITADALPGNSSITGVTGAATGGSASLFSSGGSGGLITVGGNAFISASAFAGSAATGGAAAGAATGGSASISATGNNPSANSARISITGTATVIADAFGSASVAAGNGGTGTGGNASLSATTGGQVISGFTALSASGVGGAAGVGGTAGAGRGGTVSISASAGAVSLGAATLIAQGVGGAGVVGAGPGGTAGNGTGGSVRLEALTGSTISVVGAVSLDAQGVGGSGTSAVVGNGIGGFAGIDGQGGVIDIDGTATLNASATGGSGASATTGGSATSGTAEIRERGAGTAGLIDIAGAVTMSTNATGGAGLSGGAATRVVGTGFTFNFIVAEGAGLVRLGNVSMIARSVGGAATGVNGVGGAATGGFPVIENRTTLNPRMTIGALTMDGSATGGAAVNGTGGAATGGPVSISAGRGAPTFGAIIATSIGTGGAGRIGGAGTGGNIFLGANDLGSITAQSFSANASGVGGAGSAGNGGVGTGGGANVQGFGRPVTISGDVNLTASGSGGTGTGAGGAGTGGFATIFAGTATNSNNVLTVGSVTIGGASTLLANGFGGAGVPTGGLGTGGSATLSVNASAIAGGATTIRAVGVGGTGAAAGAGRGGFARIDNLTGTIALGATALSSEGVGGGGAVGGEGRGGQSTVVSRVGGVTTLASALVNANGYGGGFNGTALPGTDGGNGVGGLAEVRATDANSRVTINAQGPLGTPQFVFGLLSATGVGGDNSGGGDNVGGTGTGGSVQVNAQTGGVVTLPLSLTATQQMFARGFGGDASAEGGVGGIGQGGTATLDANGGTIIGRRLAPSTFGEGGSSLTASANISGGEGRGGTRQVLARAGGLLQISTIGGTASGQGGAASGTGTGGIGRGGTALTTINGGILEIAGVLDALADAEGGGGGAIGGDAFAGTSTATVTNGGVIRNVTGETATLFLRANGSFGQGTTRGGAARGGTVTLQGGTGSGSTINLAQLTLEASAQGSTLPGPVTGLGGTALGGTVQLSNVNAADLWTMGALNLAANATGGAGGSGAGGAGTAGSITMSVRGVVQVTGAADFQATGTGGAGGGGGAGGAGSGGAVNLTATGGGLIDVDNGVTVDSSATGGAGAGAGVGGAANAGAVNIQSTGVGSVIDLAGTIRLTANATGGAGATGGAATGATIRATANRGVVRLGDIIASSTGRGGAASGATGTGGVGTGGSFEIEAITDAANSRVTFASLNADVSGFGGAASGTGGAGRGGRFDLDTGGGAITGGAVVAVARGTGGNGAVGGLGQGGSAVLNAELSVSSPDAQIYQSISFDVGGQGGAGSAGNGGEGRGGDVTFFDDDTTIDVAGDVTLTANGVGGAAMGATGAGGAGTGGSISWTAFDFPGSVGRIAIGGRATNLANGTGGSSAGGTGGVGQGGSIDFNARRGAPITVVGALLAEATGSGGAGVTGGAGRGGSVTLLADRAAVTLGDATFTANGVSGAGGATPSVGGSVTVRATNTGATTGVPASIVARNLALNAAGASGGAITIAAAGAPITVESLNVVGRGAGSASISAEDATLRVNGGATIDVEADLSAFTVGTGLIDVGGALRLTSTRAINIAGPVMSNFRVGSFTATAGTTFGGARAMITSAAGIDITAAGDLTLDNAQAAGAIALTSTAGAVQSAGLLNAGTDVTLRAGTDIAVNDITAGRNVSLTAARNIGFRNVSAPNGSVTLSLAGAIAGTGTLAVGASLSVTNSGDIVFGTVNVGQDIILTSNNGRVTIGTGTAGRDIILRALVDVSATTLTAGRDVDIQTLVGNSSPTIPRTVTVGTVTAARNLFLGTFGALVADRLITTGAGAMFAGSSTSVRVNSMQSAGTIELFLSPTSPGGATIGTGLGGIEVTTLSAAGGITAFNQLSGLVLGTTNAGGPISVNVATTARFTGAVNAPNISVTSGNIDIAQGAQLGGAATQQVTLNARPSTLQSVLGGTTEGPGWTLSNAEAGRIRAQTLAISVQPTGQSATRAADLLIRDLSLVAPAGAAAGVNALRITVGTATQQAALAGIVTVEGAVRLTGASASSALSISAAGRVEIVNPGGSLRVLDAAGLPSGSITLTSANIWSASQTIINQLRADVNFTGRNQALRTNNGADAPRGYIEAGDVTFEMRDTAFVQNSGTGLFAGITVTQNTLTFSPTSSTAAQVFAFGRRINPDGSFVSGDNFFREVAFGPLTGRATRYTSDSEFNTCSIIAGGCTTVSVPPPTDQFGEVEDVSDIGVDVARQQLIDSDFDNELLLEEAVTSGGDSSLWECEDEDDASCRPVGSEEP